MNSSLDSYLPWLPAYDPGRGLDNGGRTVRGGSLDHKPGTAQNRQRRLSRLQRFPGRVILLFPPRAPSIDVVAQSLVSEVSQRVRDMPAQIIALNESQPLD